MPNPSGWHRKRKSAADAARAAKYNGVAHQSARRYYRRLVDSGDARCWRCGAVLVPGQWHVGHDDNDVNVIRGAECRTCNVRAAASKGARLVNARRKARGRRPRFDRAER